jgi:ubiquinone/menaquinone biosynthesis C-methylase UbiE
MNNPEHYLSKNKDAWNKRTMVHIDSEFYDMKAFMAGQTSLNDAELALLGDVKGKKILHLQCHFGQDSLSLARMGAKVTGVDLSDTAIDKAREYNTALGLDACFVCCDVYDLEQHLDETFDIVFTSYGVVGWLPDLDKWGHIIQKFLKPGGKFVMVEFHPVIWMFNNDFTGIQYSYFNKETIEDVTQGTYTDRNAPIEYTEVSWNHSLDEVFGGLLAHGIQITGFREYDYSHYNCFANMEQVAEKKYRVQSLGDHIPMMYSLTGIKS